jgi:uncharacterized protein YbjT (DUF2867 family)
MRGPRLPGGRRGGSLPGAAIVRPSVLFGPDDAFLGLFAKVIAQFPLVPVFAPHARLQPLFVDDAARAVAEIVAGWPAHAGRTFELAGPEVVTMLDLNARIAAARAGGGFWPCPRGWPICLRGCPARLCRWIN